MVHLLDGTAFIIKPSMTDIFFFPEPKRFKPETFKATNVMRKDNGYAFWMFRFDPAGGCPQHYNKGVETYMCGLPDNFTRKDLIENNLYYSCNKDARRAYCTLLIQRDGWKIPEDYPVKF